MRIFVPIVLALLVALDLVVTLVAYLTRESAEEAYNAGYRDGYTHHLELVAADELLDAIHEQDDSDRQLELVRVVDSEAAEDEAAAAK